jgi:hypothetical protein
MNYYTVISGPVPIYSNVAINAQYYQPSLFFIAAITMGQTTIVTTTVNHNYVIGQEVRLLIPEIFASLLNGVLYQIPTCTQLDQQLAYVIAIPAANQITLQLDSTNANSFVVSTQPAQPQIVATGNINSGAINTSGNVSNIEYIPGSFINISPL